MRGDATVITKIYLYLLIRCSAAPAKDIDISRDDAPKVMQQLVSSGGWKILEMLAGCGEAVKRHFKMTTSVNFTPLTSFTTDTEGRPAKTLHNIQGVVGLEKLAVY